MKRKLFITIIAVVAMAIIVSIAVLYSLPRAGEPGGITPIVTEETHLIYSEEDLALRGRIDYPTIEGEIGGFNRPEVVKWTGDNYYLSYTTVLGDTDNLATVMRNGDIIWQYKCTSLIENPFKIVDMTLRTDSVLMLIHGYGVYEIDYEGDCIFGLAIDGLTHQAELLPNGNILLVRTDFDQVIEITREGKTAWEWAAIRQIVDYSEDTYIGYAFPGAQAFGNIYARYREGTPDCPTVWTHVNGAQKLDDGYLLCLRNLSLVVKVNDAGDAVWTFGALILKHPHRARLLDNGNLLVLDNGNARVAEFNPEGELIFEFTLENSPVLGWVEKLWNGNYLLTDTLAKRILEVTPEGVIVKEIHTADPVYQAKAYKLGTINIE